MTNKENDEQTKREMYKQPDKYICAYRKADRQVKKTESLQYDTKLYEDDINVKNCKNKNMFQNPRIILCVSLAKLYSWVISQNVNKVKPLPDWLND